MSRFSYLIGRFSGVHVWPVLGVPRGVSREALRRAKGNFEGAIVKISFTELESALTGDEKWVPAGKANVLAWLALGAPSSDGRSALFNGRTGQELFNSIVP